MNNENNSERRDEGELTPEELQEKADEARERAFDVASEWEEQAKRDVEHAIAVNKMIMSAFKLK